MDSWVAKGNSRIFKEPIPGKRRKRGSGISGENQRERQKGTRREPAVMIEEQGGTRKFRAFLAMKKRFFTDRGKKKGGRSHSKRIPQG